MSSWKRLSLRKSPSQAFSSTGGGGGGGKKKKSEDKSNEIVRYRGVSLQFLQRLWQDVKEGKRAAAVDVFELVEDVEEVKAGSVVQLADFSACEDEDEDAALVRVPFRREVLEVGKEQIVRKPRKEWTIWDVCEFVVMPEVTNGNTFFIDHVQKKHLASAAYEGAFVSQSRATKFESLIEALSAHYTASKDLGSVYIWLDILCVNQPLTNPQDARGMKEKVAAERKTLLTSGLHDAIAQFDEILIMFDSWLNPHCLTRAWCVWEIYGAAISEKTMNIVFDELQAGAMLDALGDEGEDGTNRPWDVLLEALSDLDLRKMKCHSEQDLADITEAVESLDGGFGALKATINDRLRKWILNSLENAVKDSEHSETKEAATLMYRAGRVMTVFDRMDVAENYLKRALQLRLNYSRTDHTKELGESYHALGSVYSKQHKCAEALGMYEKALEIKKHVHGKRHKSVADTHNSMGKVYYREGKYAEALEMYEKALEIKKYVHGGHHLTVAITYNNMGSAYTEQGKYPEALEMYERALAITKQVRGNQHYWVAVTYFNMGILFQKESKPNKAHSCFSHAYDIFSKALGMDHRKTRNAKTGIDQTK